MGDQAETLTDLTDGTLAKRFEAAQRRTMKEWDLAIRKGDVGPDDRFSVAKAASVAMRASADREHKLAMEVMRRTGAKDVTTGLVWLKNRRRTRTVGRST